MLVHFLCHLDQIQLKFSSQCLVKVPFYFFLIYFLFKYSFNSLTCFFFCYFWSFLSDFGEEMFVHWFQKIILNHMTFWPPFAELTFTFLIFVMVSNMLIYFRECVFYYFAMLTWVVILPFVVLFIFLRYDFCCCVILIFMILLYFLAA